MDDPTFSGSGDEQSAVEPARLRGIVEFLQAAERLKDTLRSGATAGGRTESVAEHSWRLCLMVMLFEQELAGLDHHRLLKLCVIHDLGEAVSGDVPAIHQTAGDGKAGQERADLVALCAGLSGDLRGEIIDLWDEYNSAATPEAILAKGFDKLETMLQHAVGRNVAGFDYAFNLSYGVAQTGRHPLLRQIRSLVDDATRARLGASEGAAGPPDRPAAINAEALSPRVGGGAAILRDGRLLLVKRRRAPEADHWGLPGGKVDWLEPVPAAVAREIAEELGLEIGPQRLLCVVDHIDKDANEHWVAPVYVVDDAVGEPRVLESEALAGCGWFALDDLPAPLTRATVQAVAALAAKPRDAQ